MPTGYEVEMYTNIGRSAKALERIADSLGPAADKPNVSYNEAVEAAHDLIEEPGTNPEYERGIAELIRDLWGKTPPTLEGA